MARSRALPLSGRAGDEARRGRILSAMQQSFTRLDGVLDPAEGMEDAQSIDLVSGLEIRKPRLSHSGFFVTGDGVVVTTADVVNGCGRVTIDRDVSADVLLADGEAGIAVLKPTEALSPMATAPLAANTPVCAARWRFRATPTAACLVLQASPGDR